jgi:hypothetical protein
MPTRQSVCRQITERHKMKTECGGAPRRQVFRPRPARSQESSAQATLDDGVLAIGDYDPVQPDVLEWEEIESGTVWNTPDLYLCSNR